MSDDPTQNNPLEPGAEKAFQLLADEFRESIGNAYAFIEGRKTTQTFAAKTPEDLMKIFVDRVRGANRGLRPNVYNRYQKIQEDVLAAVEQIRKIPPSEFVNPPMEKTVNTPVDVEITVQEVPEVPAPPAGSPATA